MKRLIATGLLTVAFAAGLAACAKNSESSSSSSAAPEASAAATSAATTAAVAQNGAAASDGAKVFETNCSSCHQTNGKGLAGTFPPLAGNPVVVGDPKTVIHIVKYGLNGKLTIAGHDYNGMMPAWGQQLSNGDIASVITYIRSAWGNTASAVSGSDVAAVSK